MFSRINCFAHLTAVCFLLQTAAGGFIPKIPKPVDPPEVPSFGSPGKPAFPKPDVPGGGESYGGLGSGSGSASAGFVESNVASLNARLDNAYEIAQGVSDVAQEIINAILETATTSEVTAAATVVGSVTGSSTTEPPSSTSTRSVNSASYKYCKSYAKSLRSCAAATPSFHSLKATVQASCACYTTPYAQTGSCLMTPTVTPTASSVRYYQKFSVPTAAADSFDSDARLCWQFFNDAGYSNVAAVLKNSTKVPGYSFCASVDAILSGTGANATSGGLKDKLEPTPVSECLRYIEFQSAGRRIGAVDWILIVIPLAILGTCA